MWNNTSLDLRGFLLVLGQGGMFKNTSDKLASFHDEEDADYNKDDDDDTPSKILSKFTSMFILVLFTLAALAGNGVICYLVHTKHHLKTIPNRLVLNLSWCGTLTAALNGPLMLLATARQEWILGKSNSAGADPGFS